MEKTLIIVVLLFWLVATDRMPSLMDIGHEIAKHILPPTK